MVCPTTTTHHEFIHIKQLRRHSQVSSGIVCNPRYTFVHTLGRFTFCANDRPCGENLSCHIALQVRARTCYCERCSAGRLQCSHRDVQQGLHAFGRGSVLFIFAAFCVVASLRRHTWGINTTQRDGDICAALRFFFAYKAPAVAECRRTIFHIARPGILRLLP